MATTTNNNDEWRRKRERPGNPDGDADENAPGFFLEGEPVAVLKRCRVTDPPAEQQPEEQQQPAEEGALLVGVDLWRHPDPTVDARLIEFDLTQWDALIANAIHDAQNHLIYRPAIKVRGKECNMRRSVGLFAEKEHTHGYFFSNQLMAPFPPSEAMTKLMEMVSKWIGAPVNGMLVNLYRGGEDCIAQHSDDEKGITQSGVFSISVGAERHFDLTYKKNSAMQGRFRIPTKHMHGLLMAGKDFQRTMEHGIPKQAMKDGDQNWRWSATFRCHDKAAEEPMMVKHKKRNGITNGPAAAAAAPALALAAAVAQ